MIFSCNRLYSLSLLRTRRLGVGEQASDVEQVDAKKRLDIGVALSSFFLSDKESSRAHACHLQPKRWWCSSAHIYPRRY